MSFLTPIQWWPVVAGGLTVLLALLAAGHVVLYKRDVRAAAGWVGVVLVFPVAGPILYLLLGINRISRLAAELRQQRAQWEGTTQELHAQLQRIEEVLPPEARHLAAVGRLVDRVTRVPVTAGNRVTPLCNGEVAYPAMLEAIDGAQETVALSTYIFDRDPAGLRFVEALGRAVARGVEVRVLIDGVGAMYSRPPVVAALRRRGVRVARFLFSWIPWRMSFMNLRSHRKILIADGTLGFTGGMNIRHGHDIAAAPRSPVRDIHFRVEGPVVNQLMQVFAEDWAFTTGEWLQGDGWFPPPPTAGPVVARAIPDGPDEDLDKLRWTIHGALARAQHRIRIVTPYFLPDAVQIAALNTAAMRGVEVDIVLPRHNNLPFVSWASDAQLWQLLSRGCRIVKTEGPFDHSKIMTVDSAWALVGSANWDPRSLRLNFELNVECYDPALAATLDRIIDEKVANSQVITKAMVDGRSLPVRLRDGVARLFSPYL